MILSRSSFTTTILFGSITPHTATLTLPTLISVTLGPVVPVSVSPSLTPATQNMTIQTVYATNYTTTSTTVISTTTIQQPTSTMTITVSAVQPKNTVTGLCYWGDQAILTPCTSMVLATSPPDAAITTTTVIQNSPAISLGYLNPLTSIIRSVKNVMSFGKSSFKMYDSLKGVALVTKRYLWIHANFEIV